MESLILNIRDGFGRGAFASVIFEPSHRFAFKLFKSSSHPDHREEPPEEGKIRVEFESELNAYNLIVGHPELEKHTPKFYGKVHISSVISANGDDITNLYLPDCCLKLERLAGNDKKLAMHESQYPYLKEFASLLRASGIKYLIDASVFSPEDKEKFKIFDFAVNESAVAYL